MVTVNRRALSFHIVGIGENNGDRESYYNSEMNVAKSLEKEQDPKDPSNPHLPSSFFWARSVVRGLILISSWWS